MSECAALVPLAFSCLLEHVAVPTGTTEAAMSETSRDNIDIPDLAINAGTFLSLVTP